MNTRLVFFSFVWKPSGHQIVLTLDCKGQPNGHQVVFFSLEDHLVPRGQFFSLRNLVPTKLFQH